MKSLVSIVEYDSGIFKNVSEAYLDWYIVAKKIKWPLKDIIDPIILEFHK